ncbi:DNA cytosine methyltransferase [Vibrio mediterranei]|uniref:DNA cytosine methyltransferase n=1 Tax=Vibrio mediterranei TaxID=689 RepID=UPI0018480D36|nr:DNA cytosine methyltransferase [Vibrio mediterranei]NUW71401.1 DNA cytosine methyltransferase [Vibrio mediterranei]
MIKLRTAISLFHGLGSFNIAIDAIGLKFDRVYVSEVDPHANKVDQANNPNNIHMGSVCDWYYWDIDWSKVDVIVAGSPCQGFSMAGGQAGTKAILNGKEVLVTDRKTYLLMKHMGAEFLSQSYLFWEFVLLLDFARRKNPDVKYFLENVKMKKPFLEMITEALNTVPNFMNSAIVCAQNRQRFYWHNWGFELPEDRNIYLKDILQTDIKKDGDAVLFAASYSRKDGVGKPLDKAFALNASDWRGLNRNQTQTAVVCGSIRGRYIVDGKRADHKVNSMQGKTEQRIELRKDEETNCLTTVQKDNVIALFFSGRGNNPAGLRDLDGKSPSLTANGWHQNFKLVDGMYYRKLTCIEYERLQGVPDNYTNHVSNTQRYKMLGNGWNVDTIIVFFIHLLGDLIMNYPHVYFGGHKKYGIKSDRDWIYIRLNFLPQDLREFASEQYQNIYLYYFNRAKPRLARFYANVFLQMLVEETVTQKEIENVNEDLLRKNALSEKIEHVKQVQRESAPRIDLSRGRI